MIDSFDIPTGPESMVWQRHCTSIKAIHVWPLQKTVYLQGVGLKGRPLEGSGFVLQADELDELAARWLNQRGFIDVSTADNIVGTSKLRAAWMGKTVKLLDGATGVVDAAHVTYKGSTLWVNVHGQPSGSTFHIAVDPGEVELIP